MEEQKISKKRIAVVSGAMGYVGFETAKKLADDGMRVAMLYHNTQEEIVQEKLASLVGKGHQAYKCDLRNEKETKDILELIEKEMGAIHACIHAAGKGPSRKAFIHSSVEDIKDQFETNVLPSFIFLTSVANHLKSNQEGVLIGITTAGVLVPQAAKSLGGYIPAKFAVEGMLTLLKEELSPHVRVYSIAPGFMEGGMNRGIPQAFVQMIREKDENRILITAEDVANKISYLCKEDTRESNLTHLIQKSNETGN